MKKPIALLVSDIHLSLEPPIARSHEPDWLAAQKRSLDQLCDLQEKYDIPVICAGDLFHTWKVAPELISFALSTLPEQMFAIPGQHDLPHHNIKDIQKSGFGVLFAANRITYMQPGRSYDISRVSLYPFPWGFRPVALEKRKSGMINMAVVHAYCWNKNHKHPGAEQGSFVGSYDLKGYDVALFGDNHQRFLTKARDTLVFNHGCFIQRASNERHQPPRVGVLCNDGSIFTHELDTSKDVWLPEEKAKVLESNTTNIRGLLTMLDELGASGEDFEAALKAYFREFDVPRSVQQIIKEALCK